MAKKLAFFLENIKGRYQGELIENLTYYSKLLDYELDIFSGFGPFAQNYLHEQSERNVINLPYLEDYVGVIVAPDTYNIKGLCEELLDKLQELKCPVITLRYKDERFYNIYADDCAAMSVMVEHFIVSHGCKKICFMTGVMDREDAKLRLKGYLETMKKHNLPVTDHMIFEGDFWKNKGHGAVEWYLEEGIPEAIVCSNDYMAISVCEALRERGYSVPGDVRVSGFDNLDDAKFFEPPIASIEVSVKVIADITLQLVDRINNGEKVEQYVNVPVEGVFCGTCGCAYTMQEKHITNLYTSHDELIRFIHQITYMTVDMESCNTMDELFYAVNKYSWNFKYDTMYVCLCDRNTDKDYELDDDLYFTQYMKLRAIMSSKHGVTICDETFERREILPQKYKKNNTCSSVIPLHYQNHCLGYLVLHTSDIKGLTEMFSAWVTLFANSIDKVRVYEDNKNLMFFREQALLDELTGLYNRRMVEKVLRNISSNDDYDDVDFSIVSIDMDGLKFINDNYGHSEGDMAICALADILKEVSGKETIAARVGGDEFMLYVNLVKEKDVKELVNTINQKIDTYNNENKKAYKLSASIGYALHQTGMDVSECINAADEKMYAEKEKRKKKTSYRARD